MLRKERLQALMWHCFPQRRQCGLRTQSPPASLPDSLSANGERSLLVDLSAPVLHSALSSESQPEATPLPLEPEGWQQLAEEKPPLASFADVSIYELHIRDFRCTSVTSRARSCVKRRLSAAVCRCCI